jgi:hypothetical protein
LQKNLPWWSCGLEGALKYGKYSLDSSLIVRICADIHIFVVEVSHSMQATATSTVGVNKRPQTVKHDSPLDGLVFYLDLPKDEKCKKIENALVAFGAKVESLFFNGETVTHVVTTKPLLPYALNNGNPISNNKTQDQQNGTEKQAPCMSPRKKRIQQLLTVSSVQQDDGDVISVANKMGKKIISLQQLLEWINSQLLPKSNRVATERANSSTHSPAKFPLKNPYILVEDITGTFESIGKEFPPGNFEKN